MFKKVLLTIVIVLPLLGLGLALFGDRDGSRTPQNQRNFTPTYPSRTPANVPQTLVKFENESLRINDEGLVEAEVFMAVFENQVTGVHLEIGYDPKVFSVVEVKGDDFLGNKKVTVNNVDKSSGTITFEVNIDTATTPPLMGSDAIAEVKLRPINKTITRSELTFLPGTKITAQDIAGNAIVKMENGLVNLSAK